MYSKDKCKMHQQKPYNNNIQLKKPQPKIAPPPFVNWMTQIALSFAVMAANKATLLFLVKAAKYFSLKSISGS